MERKIVDAGGKPGMPGSKGLAHPAHSTPSGSGAVGAAGGGGGPGYQGEPGGKIEVELIVKGDQRVSVSGEINDEPFAVEWNPESKTEFFLNARGGDGGRGGHGGRGQNGSRGSRGSNATRYRSGTNGGTGGGGGRGGAAGRGGDSGPGGEVTVKLPFQDSDLLIGLDWDVSSGAPGGPGEPGDGGKGGPGGSGGSSYSWTTTETYRNSKGEVRTRTRRHTKSGGFQGSSGHHGASGSPGKPGGKGRDGQVIIETEMGKYPDRYRLQCVDFELLSGDTNDIFEFGEQSNIVRGMTIQNQGPAPSPPEHVLARIGGSSGLIPGSEMRQLPSLNHSQKMALPDFSFALSEAESEKLPAVHSVLSERVVVTAHSLYRRVAFHDPDFERSAEIEVTFPVELVTEPASTSVSKDRDVWQQWTLHNRSNKSFPTPGRELWLDLSKTGVVDNLILYDEAGNDLSDGRSYRVPIIEPEGSFVLWARLTARDDAIPYSKAVLTAELRLTPHAGGEPRLIQRNPTEYNIASAHSERVADLVLVTNHGCSATEVKHWIELCESLNLTWDIWDLSLYGKFPVEELAERSPGALLVVLNSPFASPCRVQLRPLDFLDFKDFRRVLSEKQMSFYFIGERCEILDHLVPQPSKEETFSSVTNYLKTKKFEERPDSEIPLEMTESMDKISVSRFYVKGKPQPEVLKEKGTKLLSRLKKKYPQRRFLVTTIFEPDDGEGWLRNKHCGVLEVRQMPDRNSRSVVVREVYRETAQTSAFLNSVEGLLGLFSAFSWSRKTQILAQLECGAVEEEPRGIALADAILMDLYEEQFDLRRANVRLSKRGLKKALNLTAHFCQLDLRNQKRLIDPNSELGRALIRIAAGLEFTANHQVAWWDHRVRFLGGTTDVEITVFVRKVVDQFLDRNFGPDRLFGTKPIRKLVEDLCQSRLAELRADQERLTSLSKSKLGKKEVAREVLVRWELRDYLKSESEGESALWSQTEMEFLKDRERKQKEDLRVLKEGYQEALGRAESPLG